ncbi:MAG: hypothetical protein U1C71_00690, partial [archaeon]|nr:hypothetical protein [archaeon]
SSNAAAEPPPLPSPEVKAFFFTVNDSGVLGEQVFVVQKGDAVTFTISVATSNVSFGGAVIRAPAGKARDIDAFIFTTGNLSPGQVGEVSFIADESFSFAVYWPSSDIQKGKMARVEVE